MHGLGIGTIHDVHSVVTGTLAPCFQFPECTLREKINLWRAKSQSGVSSLSAEMMALDLTQEVMEINLTINFFRGIYDYTANRALAKDYFEKLNAPIRTVHLESENSPSDGGVFYT